MIRYVTDPWKKKKEGDSTVHSTLGQKSFSSFVSLENNLYNSDWEDSYILFQNWNTEFCVIHLSIDSLFNFEQVMSTVVAGLNLFSVG